MPMLCIINEKCIDDSGGVDSSFVITGKATAPPPRGVEPATKEPTTIITAITICSANNSSQPGFRKTADHTIKREKQISNVLEK
ncbi:hypothetical protein PSSHI_30250 [Photobacterium sp. R1]